MSSFRFIKLLTITTHESSALLRLKAKFNAYATHINTEWPHMSPEARKEFYDEIDKVEEKIKAYAH